MNKQFLYLAACILAAFTLVLSACSQPTGGSGYNYTVSFDKNHADATGWTEAKPETKIVSSPATTIGSLPTPPTRQDWKFGGWNTRSDGTGTLFTATTEVTADINVYAQWNTPGTITVALNISGNVSGDSVTLSSASGEAGATVTINYSLANTKINNRLAFSGISSAIAPVTSFGSGTRTYVINENDAVDDSIIINAVFTHTDLEVDTIAFTGASQEDKTYGDSPFTKGLIDIGSGGGTITYTSVNHSVATVNQNTGEITIVGAGSSVISAVKASDGEYAEATASYLLNVAQRQLTIGIPNVTTTRQYNGNDNAAVTAGTLVGRVGSDSISVSAAATYNSANVADANLITVVYTISGSSAPNYIKPVDYTVAGTITKATGIEVASSPTAASATPTSVTLTQVILINNSTVQTVEYAHAVASSPVPTSGWQDSRTFSDLTANTGYYFFARSKEDDNYQAGTAKTSTTAIKTEEIMFTVALNISGNVNGDSVNLSPASGKVGVSVTINYTVANIMDNNRLVFSGINSAIDPVTSFGTGTKTYVINENDAAANGTITINAEFTHTNLQLNTIAFTGTTENKTYGDTFTKAITTQGSGSGPVTYSSSDTSVATVTNVGAVTILKNGSSTISATKASDGTYAEAHASYTLNVAQLQLIMGNPTLTTTKTYDRTNTATVTAGTPNNKVSSDTVTISAAATYNSANVAEANQITVVYTMSGADAGKYLKPVDYKVAGTITKATGIAMSTSTNLTMATRTQTSVILNALALTGGSTYQTVEYAHATTNSAPTSGWQDDKAFNGLTPNTTYYFFARSKENANYHAGTPKASAAISTEGLWSDTIAFTGATENKAYGDASFTKTITTTGSGSGAVTYSSSDTSVATVTNAGVVNILKMGTTTITATKASDGTYAGATATYTLNVTQRQLTKANPTVTTSKVYDGNTTAAVTAVGALNNVVSGDTVTVSATATYDTASAGTNKTITVVYTIAGADVGKYIKPVNYTTNGTITKASGSALTANPTAASTTSTSITLTAATLTTATGQAIEYARNNSTTVPTTGWQESTLFTGLTANTQYYFFARSKENTNYNAGTVRTSAAIRTAAAGTPPVPPVIVDFENDAVGKKYESTRGDNEPTRVEVTADPARSGQKSLRVTTNAPGGEKGYNQAAVIPITLPNALSNYKSFSFRFYPVSGTSTGQIMVYASGSTGTFVRYGFGNPAGDSNQFAANLVGQTSSISFANTGSWIDYTITITNPSSAISNLKGNIYIAIGINHASSLDYYLDDLTFTIKDDFVPPYVPPAPIPPSTGAVTSGNYRNMFKEMGKTDAEITAKVTTTFNKLFSGTDDQKVYYESGNMAYILDSGNNDVRSEGMSYGMMMCVQMNDQNKFDKLWRWAKTYMYNPPNVKIDNIRGYFSWQCSTTGSVKDKNPAPDGEFYFVTSLLFAHARWGSGTGDLNYRQHAMQILYDMIHRDSGGLDNWGAPSMFRTEDYNGAGKYMTVFSTIGGAANHTDPSYHLPAFYEVWAIEMERDADDNNLYGIWSNAAAMKTDAAFYKNAANTSRSFFPKTTNTTTGLGPDYANFDGTATGSQPYFEYDAWRIAMNVAMDYAWFASDPWQITFADRIQSFFYSKGVTSYKSLWQLNGTARQNEGDHSPGLVAGNSVASLAATHERAWEFLDDFWNISMTPGQYRYYDGCLYMLGLLHVTGNFKAYLSGGGNYVPSSSIDPTSATFDKRSDLQKDIDVTVTLNGNTLSRISNGATNLTNNTDYTVSGNGTTSTVTLRKAYLAARPIGTTTLTFNFSAGSARTLSITVKETPAGGTPSGGTSFDFTTLTDVTVEYTTGGGVTASINNGALRVEKTTGHSSVGFVLTFDLGSQTLSSFTGVRYELRAITGDFGYKDFKIEVANTEGGTFNSFNNNTALVATHQINLNTTTYTTYEKTFASGTHLSRGGQIKIAFGLVNVPAGTYEIRKIELY